MREKKHREITQTSISSVCGTAGRRLRGKGQVVLTPPLPRSRVILGHRRKSDELWMDLGTQGNQINSPYPFVWRFQDSSNPTRIGPSSIWIKSRTPVAIHTEDDQVDNPGEYTYSTLYVGGLGISISGGHECAARDSWIASNTLFLIPHIPVELLSASQILSLGACDALAKHKGAAAPAPLKSNQLVQWLIRLRILRWTARFQHPRRGNVGVIEYINWICSTKQAYLELGRKRTLKARQPLIGKT
ncbi:hypothetical protein K438DRAFT_1945266 [Mycena galopus ATCC 62051]|nr:hypothetical protein K438DRAFT_1945266 [Mycena galopus ATCC 62051]